MRRAGSSLISLALAVMIAVLPSPPLDAATLYWSATTDGLWTNAANWSTDPVAGGSSSAPTNSTTADVVVFNQSSVNRGETISFGADASIAGIVVSNTGSTTLASDSATARSLTIGASGLSVFGAGGTVTLGSASNPLSVAVTASQAWANNSTRALQVLGNVTSSAASGTQTLTIAGSGSTTLSGIVGNGGVGGILALTKSGSGTLSLTGAATNTYTGNTTISFGSLLLDYGNLATPTDLIASTSALVVNGGAVTLKGKSSGATSQSFNGTSIAGGGGKVLVDPNGGTSTTVNLGSLPALNAWSAGTTLLVGKAAGAGSGTAAVTTTTGTDATGIYGGRMVYFSGTANTGYDWATSSGSGPYTLGAYTGYSALATSGTDTANSRVTANTTPTGNVTTNSLKIENPAASQSLALGSNTLALSSGGLLVTGSNAFSITGGQLTAGNGSGGYELIVHQYSSGTTTISGSITNNGANAVTLTKSGPGVLALTGTASTFTGDVRISEGTLVLGANAAISKNTNSSLGAGTTIYLDGGMLQTPTSFPISPLNFNRDVVLSAGKTSTVSNVATNAHLMFNSTYGNATTGVISGGGTLELVSPGGKGIFFGGPNTFSGGVIVNSNVILQVYNDGVGSPGNITSGPLGTGTVTFRGGNLQGGMSSGTRTVLNPYVLDGDLQLIFSTGNVATIALAGNGTLTGTRTLSVYGNGVVVSGTLGERGGQYGLTVAGTSTLSLNAANTFSGDVRVTGTSTLALGHVNALQNATLNLLNTDVGTVTFMATGTNTYNFGGLKGARNLSIGANSLSVGLNGQSTTYSGTIAGTGGLAKVGSGTLTLSAANTYSGTTTVSAGVLQAGVANTFGSSSPLAVNSGTVNLGGFSQAVGGLSGSAGTVITTNNAAGSATLTTTVASGIATFAGSIADNVAGTVAFTKAGAGTQVLSGTNTFSGATSIAAGILSISGTSALAGTSSLTIAGGAGLTYTGGAATFAKNITVTAGSGTGTVTNSGGGLLTLAGTLSKDNSILRLTGGAFNVTGLITGTTVGASDLVVDAASVMLSNTNTYNGPTYVYNSGTLTLGIANAIPNSSVVTLGNALSAGTLELNGYTDAIGGLAFGSGGGTLRLAATSTSAAPLTAAAGTMTLTGGTLDLAGSGSTAGLYRVLSAQSITGSFSSVTGASAAYQLLTTSTSVDYQQKAVLGAVTVTNPAVSIITGGSAAFTYTVANAALSGGATLSYTGTGLSNVAGSSGGSASSAGTSGATSGLFFTGTTVGSGQGTFTVNAPTAYGATTATGTVAVTVLDHATSSLAAALTTSTTISLGTWNYSSQTWESGTNSALFSIYNIASGYGAGFTADLSLLGVTGTANGFSTNLGGYADIAGGSSAAYSIFFNPTGFNSSGTQLTTFALSMSDKTGLSGATSSNTLYVTANVVIVPEPGGLVLAGIGAIGAIGAAWAAQRRRRAS